jgi:hypothetical protein
MISKALLEKSNCFHIYLMSDIYYWIFFYKQLAEIRHVYFVIFKFLLFLSPEFFSYLS